MSDARCNSQTPQKVFRQEAEQEPEQEPEAAGAGEDICHPE